MGSLVTLVSCTSFRSPPAEQVQDSEVPKRGASLTLSSDSSIVASAVIQHTLGKLDTISLTYFPQEITSTYVMDYTVPYLLRVTEAWTEESGVRHERVMTYDFKSMYAWREDSPSDRRELPSGANNLEIAFEVQGVSQDVVFLLIATYYISSNTMSYLVRSGD